MRSSFAVAVLFGIAWLPFRAFAQTAVPAVAPLDEYFGSTNESILEIRNRITAVEIKPETDARTTDAVAAIDFFQDALLDWQHKYPADPWVVDALSRTVRCYARAGVATSAHAAEIYAILEKTYPRTTGAERALLAVWEAPAAGSAFAGAADARVGIIP